MIKFEYDFRKLSELQISQNLIGSGMFFTKE